MKLRFLAAGHAHVPERNQDGSALPRQAIGGLHRYVGRAYDASAPGGEHYPPTKEPYECEAGTGEAVYLARAVKDGDLIVADKATADALGVPFDGPKATPKPAKDGS